MYRGATVEVVPRVPGGNCRGGATCTGGATVEVVPRVPGGNCTGGATCTGR